MAVSGGYNPADPQARRLLASLVMTASDLSDQTKASRTMHMATLKIKIIKDARIDSKKEVETVNKRQKVWKSYTEGIFVVFQIFFVPKRRNIEVQSYL